MYVEGGKRFPTLPVSLVSLGQQSCLSKYRCLSLSSPRLVALKAARPDRRSLHTQLGSTARLGMLLMLGEQVKEPLA